MNKKSFSYDVFISAADSDLAKGKELQEALKRSGLRSYLYTEENHVTEDFWKKIVEGLTSSEYLIVLASPSACQSNYVKSEVEFFSKFEAVDPTRKVFRMKVGRGCPELLPSGILHADTIASLVPEVVRYHVEQRRLDCSELATAVDLTQAQLEKRDSEAFGHYRRSRFWRQMTSAPNVHIFTCGRDTPPDDAASAWRRGSRTTIDKWDYRTVLDITHFLNRHYPATHVQIEDPVSKLSQRDLREIWAAERLAELQGLLRNKNCIIVGSPDVSDFAEIVLAKTHNMRPYNSERVKQTGYVIIKDAAKVSAPSSHYWTTCEDEKAGVAKLGGDSPVSFPARVDSSGAGEMCGILAVVANPFCDLDAPMRRIVLLSGFSGVATNAIAKFLTHDAYLTEFGRFDREYVDVSANIEVLIGVQFSGQAHGADGDRREIRSVTYRGLAMV